MPNIPCTLHDSACSRQTTKTLVGTTSNGKKESPVCRGIRGALGRTRTCDLLIRSHSPSGTRAILAVQLIRLLRVLSVASASCEPGIELGAVIAGSALGEVVSGDPLPGRYLLERLDRLAPKVLGGLLRGHPLGRPHVGQILCCSGQAFGRFGQCQGDTRERLDLAVFENALSCL